ncbi:unnamed protein product, partial [Allacma fusca]
CAKKSTESKSTIHYPEKETMSKDATCLHMLIGLTGRKRFLHARLQYFGREGSGSLCTYS